MTQLYLISPPKFELADFRKSLEAALSVNIPPACGSRSDTPTVYARPSDTPTVYRGGKGGAILAGTASSNSPPFNSPPQAVGIKFVGAFQLRLKDADDAQIKAAIQELLPICQAHEVAFILNDRPDLCAELKCDGVHLGQEDLENFTPTVCAARSDTPTVYARPSDTPPVYGGGKGGAILAGTASSNSPPVNSPPQAVGIGPSMTQPAGIIEHIRAIIGDDAVLGITCHASRHLAMEAGEFGADYVAFGAFYETTSKPKEKLEKWGTPTADIIEWWTTTTTLPCVAIGGITPNNCLPLVSAGADFIAVITAVWQHEGGPAAAIQKFRQAISLG